MFLIFEFIGILWKKKTFSLEFTNSNDTETNKS